MQEIFKEIVHGLDAGRPSLLAVIVHSSGSTPRSPGACMLILPDGSTLGTVGGGISEYQALCRGRELLAAGENGTARYVLRSGDAESNGMVCGGEATVFFRCFTPGREADAGLCRAALDCLERDEDAWLFINLSPEHQGELGLYSASSGPLGCARLPADIASLPAKAAILETPEGQLFCQSLVRAGRVYVFGGGHVSQALVPLLTTTGFRCTVFDDRPEFLTPQLFPTAEARILGDFGNIGAFITVTSRDFLVIMTRGHRHDYALQTQALATPACYIGVIGSRQKAALGRARLLADGFSPEEAGRIFCPVGLDIGAETPAEIAVSVAGQMIACRAGLPIVNM